MVAVDELQREVAHRHVGLEVPHVRLGTAGVVAAPVERRERGGVGEVDPAGAADGCRVEVYVFHVDWRFLSM